MDEQEREDVLGGTGSEEGEAFLFPVELSKIREFAKALKSPNSVWMSESAALEAGLEGVPAPPTFPISAGFWDPPPAPGRSDISLDLRFVLHGEQEFIYHESPPVAGERLYGRQRLVDVYEKEGKRGGVMKFVVTETNFYDESGKRVASSRSTLIETGGAVARES